jgi:hypothetical protein
VAVVGVNDNNTTMAPVSAALPTRFVRVDDFSHYPAGHQPSGYALEDGTQPVSSTATIALPAAGAPFAGMGALKLGYDLSAAPADVRLVVRDAALAPIEGQPKALGLWLDGDDSGVLPYLRFADSSGQLFQEGGGPIDWQGWRYVLIYMDTPRGRHWGGANDGVIHYPIRWDSLLLIENPFPHPMQGSLYVSAPTLLY